MLETTSLKDCQNSSSWAFHAAETFQVGSHLALRLLPQGFGGELAGHPARLVGFVEHATLGQGLFEQRRKISATFRPLFE